MTPSALASAGVAPYSNPQSSNHSQPPAQQVSGNTVRSLYGAAQSGNASQFSNAMAAAGFRTSGDTIMFGNQTIGSQQELSKEISNTSSPQSLKNASEDYANWATAHPVLSFLVNTIVGNVIPGAGILSSVLKMIGNHFINQDIKSAQSNTAAQGNYFYNQSTGNHSQDFVGNSDFSGLYPNVSINYGSDSGGSTSIGPIQDVTNQYENNNNNDNSNSDSSNYDTSGNYNSSDNTGSSDNMNMWDGSTASSCPDVDAWVIKKFENMALAVRAWSVRAGDQLLIVNPKTGEERWGTVTFSQRRRSRRVTVTLKNGAALTCSTTAPLGTKEGQVIAPDAYGHAIANKTEDKFGHDECCEVRSEGEGWVQHIECEDDFFLAGNTRSAMLAHHNMKAISFDGGSTSGSDTMSFDMNFA